LVGTSYEIPRYPIQLRSPKLHERSLLVWQVWERRARENPDREAIIHRDVLGSTTRWTRGGLLEAAGRFAAKLLAAGVNTGDVCAIILRHHKDFYPIYLGVTAIGALPAVLAYPNARLHPAKFAHGLTGMSQRSGLDWILTDAELSAIIGPLATTEGTSIRGLLYPLEWNGNADTAGVAEKRRSLRPSDPFLLQHSSGTTGLQKPVVLSHLAVLEHVRRYAEAVALRTDDKVVSWLPLYHDMGLIAAFHLPLAFGITSVQIDPFQWVSSPFLLLQAIAEEEGTVVWLPNFAYNFLADRVHDDELAGLDLSRVRILVNCSEPVRSDSHDRFLSRFSAVGLRRETLAASYAMAEATFAVTQTPPGREAERLTVDRDALKLGIVRVSAEGSVRTCVSSGTTISGCEVRIVDEMGKDLPDDVVGEIILTSISIFSGYRNYPEKTAEVLRDGWFLSGDLGFLHGGELYVVGRKKDVIISAGKNLYPEDIEDAVGQVAGVLPGRVIAFSVEDPENGTDLVAVVAETQSSGAARGRLRLAITQAAMSIDVTVRRVYLVPPRWLIKSSAGKPSRKDNRERILSLEAPAASLEG
jgi:fatty-acyl-CoA synthase